MSAREDEIRLAAAEIGFMKLLELLDAHVSEEPCRWDHNNSCQEHGFSYVDRIKECPTFTAQRILEKSGLRARVGEQETTPK